MVNVIISSPNMKVLTNYLLPVLIVAIATSIPRFLEMTHHVYNTVDDNEKDKLPKVGVNTHTFSMASEKKVICKVNFYPFSCSTTRRI